MAEVERSWSRHRFAGLDVPKRYQTAADPDGDFTGAAAVPAVAEDAWAAWREEVAFVEQFTADHDLGFAGRDSEGEPVSLRELLVHMIEEVRAPQRARRPATRVHRRAHRPIASRAPVTEP